ncbi:hypothetical protein VCUG_00523 [Vavraia culicis subsp. floridensis]|uniref:Uncharacterized protein n=1 Tax=Vavraia culicis (isolate floridensis) TaxID=948595 RepID=L2GXX8_VAVCU|nr:uncharacterized protein VCUG_00523 [Vavraia culicis subsp. floridensis]ELA47940.1 hypothetical protein VCUG_00523 [Vavraia culicis subsp. floridensis]
MRTIALLNRSKAAIPKKVQWLKNNILKKNDKILVVALERCTTAYVPAMHRCTWLPAVHRSACTNAPVAYYKSVLCGVSNDKRLVMVRENECARVMEVLERCAIDVVVVGKELLGGDEGLFRMLCACMRMSVVLVPV